MRQPQIHFRSTCPQYPGLPLPASHLALLSAHSSLSGTFGNSTPSHTPFAAGSATVAAQGQISAMNTATSKIQLELKVYTKGTTDTFSYQIYNKVMNLMAARAKE